MSFVALSAPTSSLVLWNTTSVGLITFEPPCSPKFAPVLMVPITILISWVLLILQEQIPRVDIHEIKRLCCCKCCWNKCQPAKPLAKKSHPEMIDEITTKIIDADIRYLKSFNIIRRPFAAYFLFRTLYSILEMWVAIGSAAQEGCITNFGTFAYFLLSEEVTRQTQANGLLIIETHRNQHTLFGSKFGLSSDDLTETTSTYRRLLYHVYRVILGIIFLHSGLVSFFLLICLWPHFYLLAIPAAIVTVLTKIYRKSVESRIFPEIQAFCEDYTRLCVPVDTRMYIVPETWLFSMKGSRRTRSEQSTIIRVILLQHTLEAYCWRDEDVKKSLTGQVEFLLGLPNRLKATALNRLLRLASEASGIVYDECGMISSLQCDFLRDVSRLMARIDDVEPERYYKRIKNLVAKRKSALEAYEKEVMNRYKPKLDCQEVVVTDIELGLLTREPATALLLSMYSKALIPPRTASLPNTVPTTSQQYHASHMPGRESKEEEKQVQLDYLVSPTSLITSEVAIAQTDAATKALEQQVKVSSRTINVLKKRLRQVEKDLEIPAKRETAKKDLRRLGQKLTKESQTLARTQAELEGLSAKLKATESGVQLVAAGNHASNVSGACTTRIISSTTALGEEVKGSADQQATPQSQGTSRSTAEGRFVKSPITSTLLGAFESLASEQGRAVALAGTDHLVNETGKRRTGATAFSHPVDEKVYENARTISGIVQERYLAVTRLLDVMVYRNLRYQVYNNKVFLILSQFMPMVAMMGCNLYFFTSYKDSFDITTNRVSMAEYFSKTTPVKWYNYFF